VSGILAHLPATVEEQRADELVKAEARAAIIWALSTMDRAELVELVRHVQTLKGAPLAPQKDTNHATCT